MVPTDIHFLKRAGDERIELPPKVLETPIIPFDQSPILLHISSIYRKNLTPFAALNFLGTLYFVPSEFHTESVPSLVHL